VDVRVDFVGDPVVFEKKSEEHADKEEDPAAREPGSLPRRREKWDVHDVGCGIADVRHDGQENHREKIFKMKRWAEVWPGGGKPNHANGEEDEVVEDAAWLPVVCGGQKEFAEGRGGL
jgi:hypothetical protein